LANLGTGNAAYQGNKAIFRGDAMEAQVQDWHALSEAASREQDPEKLIRLVEELNRVLLSRETRQKRNFFTN
jgi:hypothetical protein